ncbi:MAG: NRAMP family divalent metal transporter, partial [Microvirga sp.]
LVGILLVANIFNIGADLAAMGAAARLVAGGNEHVFVIAFALICALLQLFVPYGKYAKLLKWLTLSLFAYIAVVLLVNVDWPAAIRGLVWPTRLDRNALLTIVAIFGTTLSPYLFFWQSSQEAEEVATSPGQWPLKRRPRSAAKQFRRIRNDTLLGMALSHTVAVAIIIATAATLHAQGISNIQTAADAAEALRPIAGKFASVLFAIGIIGTGLLAIPVLAGSAAFAVSEVRGWREGLELTPFQASGFYSIIVLATLTGVLLDWSGIDPIKALFWAAVLNGVAAVPIMVAMMLVASRPAIMGRFTERLPLLSFGWVATAVMAAASLAMLVSVVT